MVETLSTSKHKTRIGLIGSKGRLGLAIKQIIEHEFADQVTLVATIDRGAGSSLVFLAGQVDVFLDVSIPQASEMYLRDLFEQNTQVAYVIGCTGWNEEQLKIVHSYAERAAVVLAPNFSPAVNLFLGLIEQAAPLLTRWGYDALVHETHHARKVDAPSGTAKAIVECLGNIKQQIHSSRAGNVIGTHEVRFVGPSDILSLTHEALDRSIFARGAVLAALWTSRQTKPGLYSMKEVVFGSDR